MSTMNENSTIVNGLGVLVLKLPPSIINQLFMSWLTLRDLCQLDTSLCNNILRQSYLNVLKMNDFVLAGETLPFQDCRYNQQIVLSCIQWLVLKELKVSEVSLPYNIDELDDLREKLLVISGPLLLHIGMIGYHTDCKTTILDIAGKCPRLETIELEECVVDTSLRSLLQQQHKLRKLTLQNCQGVTPSMFRRLNCDMLTDVKIFGCHSGDETIVELIKACPNLQHLDTYGSDFSDAGVIAAAPHFQSLQTLELGGHLTNPALEALASHCAQLTKFLLVGEYHLGGQQLQHQHQHQHHQPPPLPAAAGDGDGGGAGGGAGAGATTSGLGLGLGVGLGVGDQGILSVVTKCTKLRHLQVQQMPLSDNVLLAIATCLPHLEILMLGQCTELTDVGFCALATSSSMPTLWRLDISGTNITDTALVAIARHGQDLVELDIAGCARLTDKSITALAEWCVNLQTVVLDASNFVLFEQGNHGNTITTTTAAGGSSSSVNNSGTGTWLSTAAAGGVVGINNAGTGGNTVDLREFQFSPYVIHMWQLLRPHLKVRYESVYSFG